MPNKYLDSEGLAEYTGLVKSALNLKADLASPALTGTPTAPTPTAGDDSTKVATTAFVNTKASDYLPLSGGTMTGLVNFGQNLCVFTKYEHSSSISIVGGSTDSGLGILSKRGSFSDSNLILRSGDQTGVPSFTLTAGNGSTSKAIVGKPDGTLTWNGKEIERVNASGTNYIRYESGFQICWGRIGNVTTSGTTVTLPASFVGDYGLTFGNGTNAIPKFSEITTTSFKVTMTTGTDNVRYVAIGRWK